MSKPQNKRKLQDRFDLFDLKIEVHSDGLRPMICNHPLGSYFEVSGENLILPPGATFPIYCLAALLPLIPVKQRSTDPCDWISTDSEIACPDPNCGGIFRILRMKKKRFYHHEVTATPLRKSRPRPARNKGRK